MTSLETDIVNDIAIRYIQLAIGVVVVLVVVVGDEVAGTNVSRVSVFLTRWICDLGTGELRKRKQW